MNEQTRNRKAVRATSGLMALSEETGGTLTEQLFQAMRRLIADGVWSNDEKLPGSRTLARDAKVSRTTVLLAIEMLIAEGWLCARGRSGTYVARRTHAQPEQGPVPVAAQTTTAFSVGAPGLDLFPLPIWRRLQARRWSGMPISALDEGDEAGWPELRAAIAAHVGASRGVACKAEQVIIVSSAQAAIHLAALVLAERGQPVWTEDPGYFGTRSAMLAAGARPVPVPVDGEGIDVDAALRLATTARLAAVTPSCQFPLGVPMSAARRRQLLAWAREAEAWIIEDDYDSEFPFTKKVQRPLAATAEASRVIYVNTFSKTMFPALRLAYLIVPAALIDRFLAARRGIDRNTTVPNQMVLADFLNRGQFARHLRHCREAYRERRAALTEGLAREFGDIFAVGNHAPGLHVCATYSNGVSDIALCAAARREGIAAEPLSRFFAGRPAQNGILLGYAGFSPSVIGQGLHTLANAIKPLLVG